ncbi:MAG: DUF2339 domain-containing protein, partial [Gammaproteobacteria bacterium]|nr:DUF2339 domain-containing protein [Gammaproteobacteria bacterium]
MLCRLPICEIGSGAGQRDPTGLTGKEVFVGELAIWLALVGAVVGAMAFNVGGLLFGGLLGFLLGRTITLGDRLKRAETVLARLEHGVAGGEAPVQTPAVAEESSPLPDAPPTEPEPIEPGWAGEAAQPAPAVASSDALPEIEIAAISSDTPAQEKPPRGERLWNAISGFFTDGNVVVRVGIVVLFFGVAFLIKYAAERNMLPIELRLGAAALGAIALIVLGWYLRHRRTAYALLIQGGGIGIFYITVYGAAKLYQLIPMGMAFVLMVAIVALSALLALLQDSRNLAAFGISGGFLAPVLTSTGEGSHVMLFSYYALLNAGILGIAWFKAWRELNLLGFLFTFVIGAFWGAQYYRPLYFATTEPFLILFFLFYVAIAVLFALRQPLNLRGYVDGTLVFGVPVVGFALQAALVKGFEYGMAWSALSLAAFYILLATTLWRRQVEGLRLLTESFLALGIVFATLAIPLALDGRWIASAWALEGAALLWVGVRQQRLLPRISGLLLQFGAGLSWLLVVVLDGCSEEMAVLNGTYLGSLLIALAALFSSFYLQRHGERLRRRESTVHIVALSWGLLWWYGAGMHEIDRFVPWEYQLNVLLLFIALSSAALLWLCRRLEWRMLRYPLMLLLPGAALLSLNIIEGGSRAHFFAYGGLPVWLTLFAVQYRILWRLEEHYSDRQLRFAHSATLWLLLLVLSWEAHWWVREWLDNRGVWDFVIWGLLPAAAVVLLLGPGSRLSWPLGRFADTYRGEALLPVVLFIWLWSLFALGNSGDPWPLPYLPLLNPLELGQLLALLAVLMWSWHNRDSEVMAGYGLSMGVVWVAIGLAAFALLNEVVAHAVHHWGGTPYHWYSLHRSMVFQASLSVVWTLTALLLTVVATRRGWRVLWFGGAALLTAVVVKLFLIDLSRSDTMERIVSFIAVGILMLLTGYFSPLPPKQKEEQEK